MEIDHISRILNATNHFQVLNLEISYFEDSSTPFFSKTKLLRKRYKELALLVHPDKNKLATAPTAFKLVAEAYECLSDPVTQQTYIQSIKRKRSRSTTKSANSSKKNYTKTKKPKVTTKSNIPKHNRTPEDIWREFQAEEENLAKKLFHQKGFERIYTTVSDENTRSSEILHQESRECIMRSNLDAKARHWQARKKQRFNENLTQELNVVAEKEDIQRDTLSNHFDCELCRRRFQSEDALHRHIEVSTLHAKSLQASKSERSNEDSSMGLVSANLNANS